MADNDKTYFKLNITMEGDALRDTDDLAEVLLQVGGRVARMMGDPGEKAPIRDANGNTVGELRFDDQPDFKVGDKDTTGQTYDCYDPFYDEDGDAVFHCALPSGHKGLHADGNGMRIIAVWSEQ